MRFTKIFPLTLLVLSGMLLPSCLKDQEEIFDTPSSLRMQEYLDNAKATLTSSPQGWIFDYYPDRDLSYGGYVYTVKFDEANVTVGCELAPGKFETSLYKLTDDNGPILSFDSYNSLMHYFSTPSSGQYQAFDGDFEFRIMDVADDLITLKGNRTGNTMYLHRLNEAPDAFIHAAGKIYDTNVVPSANGAVGAIALTCKNDINTHYMEFFWGEDNSQSSGEYYLSTSTGIRFKNPITIEGATISELNYAYDDSNKSGTFTGEDSNGNQISLTGVLPETYAFFDDYIGNFSFRYYSGLRSINVKIDGDKMIGEYTLTGFNDRYTVAASYNKANGCLEINAQLLGINGNEAVWLAAWSLGGGGSLAWDSSYGVFVIKDPDRPGTFTITPNNGSLATDSFILWTTDLSGSSTGQLSDPNWMINGSTQLPYLNSLVKL